MKRTVKRNFLAGGILLAVFILWTVFVQCVDVGQIGPKGTEVGFAAFNALVHNFTGVHMSLYTVTDWLGLIPVMVCILFAILGLMQCIKRKSIRKVDGDILILGIYYLLVICAYLIFEWIPINYRPVLIEGVVEVSYPSSTTLLVCSVMFSLMEQVGRRSRNKGVKAFTLGIGSVFVVFMVVGRLVSGVHWFSDIVGALLLSTGLFSLYHGCVMLATIQGKE